MAWRSRKDVHSGTLCRDTTRGDGGWAEPPGGGEALWRSPQYDHEDAPVFGPAGLSAARAARVEEAWPVYGVDRQGPGSRPKRPQEAASHGAPDIRAATGRGRIFWRLHDRTAICGAGDAARPRDVRAIEPSPWSRPGGFWPGGWLYRGQEGPVPLFLHGPAALGWRLCQSLSGGDGGSFLRRPCRGVRFFRRRAAIDPLRGSRWPGSSRADGVRARKCSRNCKAITCSTTALGGPERATTRARWRGWSAMSAATS